MNTGPEIGTWAFTAQLMASISPAEDDFDWDMWKDEMKDQDLFDEMKEGDLC